MANLVADQDDKFGQPESNRLGYLISAVHVAMQDTISRRLLEDDAARLVMASCQTLQHIWNAFHTNNRWIWSHHCAADMRNMVSDLERIVTSLRSADKSKAIALANELIVITSDTERLLQAAADEITATANVARDATRKAADAKAVQNVAEVTREVDRIFSEVIDATTLKPSRTVRSSGNGSEYEFADASIETKEPINTSSSLTPSGMISAKDVIVEKLASKRTALQTIAEQGRRAKEARERLKQAREQKKASRREAADAAKIANVSEEDASIEDEPTELVRTVYAEDDDSAPNYAFFAPKRSTFDYASSSPALASSSSYIDAIDLRATNAPRGKQIDTELVSLPRREPPSERPMLALAEQKRPDNSLSLPALAPSSSNVSAIDPRVANALRGRSANFTPNDSNATLADRPGWGAADRDYIDALYSASALSRTSTSKAISASQHRLSDVVSSGSSTSLAGRLESLEQKYESRKSPLSALSSSNAIQHQQMKDDAPASKHTKNPYVRRTQFVGASNLSDQKPPKLEIGSGARAMAMSRPTLVAISRRVDDNIERHTEADNLRTWVIHDRYRTVTTHPTRNRRVGPLYSTIDEIELEFNASCRTEGIARGNRWCVLEYISTHRSQDLYFRSMSFDGDDMTDEEARRAVNDMTPFSVIYTMLADLVARITLGPSESWSPLLLHVSRNIMRTNAPFSALVGVHVFMVVGKHVTRDESSAILKQIADEESKALQLTDAPNTRIRYGTAVQFVMMHEFLPSTFAILGDAASEETVRSAYIKHASGAYATGMLECACPIVLTALGLSARIVNVLLSRKTNLGLHGAVLAQRRSD